MTERRVDADDVLGALDRLFRRPDRVRLTREGSGGTGTGGGTGSGSGTGGGDGGGPSAVVVEEDGAVVVATATNLDFTGAVAVTNDGAGHATIAIGTAATGRYRSVLYILDGAGGFTFVVDGDGNPMYVLRDLE